MRFLALPPGYHEGYTGFNGLSLAMLIAAGLVAAVWLLWFASRWFATRPRMPRPGPEVQDLPGEEPPAVVNLLVNRWKLTRSAIAATVIDLAARRVLGIDLIGHDNVVVRLRDVGGAKLTPYEQQVVDLVKARATGGSAPIEALDLGSEAAAKSWWKRFSKAVIQDARNRKLVRDRWSHRDIIILGVGLLAIIALAFGAADLARVFQSNPTQNTAADDFDDWALAGGAAWVVGMVLFRRMQAIRETPEGFEACAKWLGVRAYLQNAHALDNAPPAAVAVWERYLAYGAGMGIAHLAVRQMPFVKDDPHSGWSRYGGDWNEVRIDYPTQFEWGRKPGRVFFSGLARAVFWGAIGVVALPVVTRIAWDIGDSALSGQPGRSETIFVAAVGVVVGIAGLYIAVRFVAGVIRIYYGAADLGKTVTLEGEVVQMWNGRIAVADGKARETNAWFPPLMGMPQVQRGDIIRVQRTPHLWNVTSVEMVKRLAEDRAEAQTATEMGVPAPANAVPSASSGLPGSLNADTLSRLTGIQLLQMNTDQFSAATQFALPGGTVAAFSDGKKNTIAVMRAPAQGKMAGFIKMMATRQGAESLPNEDGAESTHWLQGHVLFIERAGSFLAVSVELAESQPEHRLEIARQVAALAASDDGAVAAG